MKEKNIQSNVMLALSQNDCKIFRNNCGVHKTEDCRFVRYGVANPGGSDLIGWKKTTITPEMVGQSVAIFTAIEVKNAKGRPTTEQLRFIEVVKTEGGIAGVCRSVEDALSLLAGQSAS